MVSYSRVDKLWRITVCVSILLVFLPPMLLNLFLRLIKRPIDSMTLGEKYMGFLLVNFIPTIVLTPILMLIFPISKWIPGLWILYALFTIGLPILALSGAMLVELDDHIKEEHGGVDPLIGPLP